MRRFAWLASTWLVAALAPGCQLPGAIPCEQDGDCPAGGRCDPTRFYCDAVDDGPGVAPPAGGLEALHHDLLVLNAPNAAAERELVPPVELTRAFLIFSATCGGLSPLTCQIAGELLVDGSVVRFSRVDGTEDVPVVISWYVIQHRDIEVRRGAVTATQGSASTPGQISPPVDPARSFVLSSVRGGGAVFDRGAWFLGELVDGASLSFRSGNTSAASEILWQVVQLPDSASVTRGPVSLGENEDEQQITVGPVTVEESFPLLTSRAMGTDPSVGPLSAHAALVGLSSSSQLRFRRGGQGLPLELSWELVSWGALRAQHGTLQVNQDAPAEEEVLEEPVDPERSLVLIPAHMRQGAVFDTDDGHVGAAWFAAELIADGTRVAANRAWGAGSAEVAYTVLEFQ